MRTPERSGPTLDAKHPRWVRQDSNLGPTDRLRDDLRHTHGTLLIKAGVPVKVVSERLGHRNPAFTIDTYQHVLSGMQAEASRVFEQLIAPAAPTGLGRLKRR